MRNTISLLVLSLILLAGCGADQRAVDGAKKQDQIIKNVQANTHTVVNAVADALQKEQMSHIETHFAWDTSLIAQDVARFPGRQDAINEVVRLRGVAQAKQDQVRLIRAGVNDKLMIIDQDFASSLKINAKLTEYVSEPGFDPIAWLQNKLNTKPEAQPVPAEEIKAEVVPLPPAK